MKKFKHVIIVDFRTGKPMAWDEEGGQLCYCTDEYWKGEPHPLQAYTVKKAIELIEKTKKNRKMWKMEPGDYSLMPFTLKGLLKRTPKKTTTDNNS